MIIYPLLPSELDDATLSRQIKSIAQTLCTVHYMFWPEKITPNIPLRPLKVTEYSQWARECAANYAWLVELGMKCCYEYQERFNCDAFLYEGVDCEHENNECENFEFKSHKLQPIIEWAAENKPLLPLYDELPSDGSPTPFPLVMPNKYIVVAKLNHQSNDIAWFDKEQEITESYRNYYRQGINQRLDGKCLKTRKKKDGSLNITELDWTRREIPIWVRDSK